jgi:hypothetical protein
LLSPSAPLCVHTYTISRGVNSTMPMDTDLGFRGKTAMEIPEARVGTRCTLDGGSLHPAIVHYMIIDVFTRSRRRWRVLCLFNLYVFICLRGAHVWLYICNQVRVYKSPSQLRIGVACLGLSESPLSCTPIRYYVRVHPHK